MFNDGNVLEAEIKKYKCRITTRGVVFDEEGKLALLYSRKFGWYEIPGGGIREGEGLEDSFLREIKEETGCDVEVIDTIGKTIETRKYDGLVNETICFVGKVVGEKGETMFEENERECDFEVLWVSLEEAVVLIRSTAHEYEENSYRKYFKRRALAILEEVGKV